MLIATYTSAADVTTAVQGVVTTGLDTFLSAAAIGVAVITVSVVVYLLRKGIKLR